MASNLLLLNQYFADLVTKGPTAIWTDATTSLVSDLNARSGQRIVATDWGYSATLCLLSDGTIPSADITYILMDGSPTARTWLRSLVADTSTLFVSHLSGAEIFAGQNQRLATIAAEAGYESQTVTFIADKFGRQQFQILRFVPVAQKANR
jgi:hypothetical protein